MIPAEIFNQVIQKCAEGLVLALADDDDGAVMVLQWCNKTFTKISGYQFDEVVGQRGTILIGPNMEQGNHLRIIEKLMLWEQFSMSLLNNRKDGDQYWQRMSWVPISDTATGKRWWLCSIIELEEAPQDASGPGENLRPITELRMLSGQVERIEQLERENKRLHELTKLVTKESHEDSLTGLSNRRHFQAELELWIAELRRGGPEFAVFYIDLDRFKFVNDTLGHDAGDRLLVSVADMLRQLTEPADVVARLGGDEFVILKPLGNSALNISSLADEIVRNMQAPFTFEGKSTSCSASVGVAIAHARLKRPEQVVADADLALYHAKSNGKGRWSFFTEEMHAESMATKQLAAELLVACKNHEFLPYFQPLINAQTGKISSAEVLVRWAHPKRGLLAPGEFLETASNIGLLKSIDEIVFARLRETFSEFDTNGVDIPRFAVNVSAGRLADPTLVHDIKSSGIMPERLIIEILESVYLERMGDVVQWSIDELKDLGVTIAIDDFGTGHASVQGLLKVKPAIVKIDRQFIQPIVSDVSSRALVASIVGIGKSLNASIVAEGVETEEHAFLLRQMGCDYLQGFYFGKPMSAADLQDRVVETNGRFWSPKDRSNMRRANG